MQRLGFGLLDFSKMFSNLSIDKISIYTIYMYFQQSMITECLSRIGKVGDARGGL
jgi:hypothetical protein